MMLVLRLAFVIPHVIRSSNMKKNSGATYESKFARHDLDEKEGTEPES